MPDIDGELVHGTIQAEALPHAHRSDGIKFTVESCTLDDEIDVEIQESNRLISLVDERSWDTARLSCEVEVPEETLEAVFPEDERDEPPGRLIVAISCRAAIGRAGRNVASAPLEPDTHNPEIPLKRDELRGSVTIQPFITRDTTRSETGNYAERKGMWVAAGRPWIVRIDEPYEGGGLLQPSVESFSNYDHLPDDQIHYLSLVVPESPQLILNSDHQLVVSILLNEEANTGAEARLRDVLYDHIEVSVWSTLLMRAIDDFTLDTGEFEHDWQENAFQLFYELLFPEADDLDDGVEELVDYLEEETDLAELNQRIEEAVYEHDSMDMPTDILKLIEEGIQND